MVISRSHPRLEQLLRQFPAVVLTGPRQVGKTTLARMLAAHQPGSAVYFDLEQPSDRARLGEEPESQLRQLRDKLVVLDEIQRVPGLFDILRGLIDRWRQERHRNGHFLLLGSASLDLLRQGRETLAGRLAQVELAPFSLAEVSAGAAPDQLWVRGGFPDSYLAGAEEESLEWRLAFIETYLERDVPLLGPRIPAETLRRFWQMLAHSQGQMMNAAQIAGALAISGQTVARYLDLMVNLMLVRRLQPWSNNLGKRLVRSPKVYIRDSGLLHALLGIANRDQLLGHPVAGWSWEGFHVENVVNALPRTAIPYFYRSAAGAELDLLVQFSPEERWAIEIKRSHRPALSRGFPLACADVGVERRIVLYAGEETYWMNDVTEVMPLARLLQELARRRAGPAAAGPRRPEAWPPPDPQPRPRSGAARR